MIDADMQRFLKLDKEDFTGKAATLAQKDEDRTLQLIYFEIDTSDSDVRGNEPIFSGDQCIGMTTSGGYGHFVKKSLGFGYVTPDLAKPGTELDVGLLDERCKAIVLKYPAHDPSNERLRD